MNDDNLNYRFRLITFNDNVSVKDPDPNIEIPSAPEEPKPPKYTLSVGMNSDAPDTALAQTTPPPIRHSHSTTGIMPEKAGQNKVLKKPRNTVSVDDFNRMIISQDTVYPDNLIDCDQVTNKDKTLKEKVKIRRKRKTQNHHKWQTDVKVIYTSETTKIPRRRSIYQPPDCAYRTHEFRDDFESLYKNDYYQQNVFKNNPAVYFQSSGDCRRDCRGIFGKFKKSREKVNQQKSCDHHFPVANMGDYCEDKERPSSYDCTHLPHLNVVGFPQENKTTCQPLPLAQAQEHQQCRNSLNTLHFDDLESTTRIKAICSQPCPPVNYAYETETGPKANYKSESKNIYDYEPTAKTPENKATTKKTSAKLCCQSEKKSKMKPNTVTMKTRSTTPKQTRPERSQCEPRHRNTTNSYLKYFFYFLAVIVFFPFVLIFSLCWVVTYPLRRRRRQAVPKLSTQCPENNNSIRKPRERNLCHLNRAPKVLANSIDNWSTIRDVVTCACKSALPSGQKLAPSRSCSPKPCWPPQCNKSSSSKVSCKKASNINFDACPIKIPPCAIKSYGHRHPDTSQQYRMFYGGALRGWLMKPLNCYGVTCNEKNKPYRHFCSTTVMPVKTAGKQKTAGKKTSLTKGDKETAKKVKTEKKAVKFSDEKANPMPDAALRPRPVRKGENRPCTDPRPSKKPCRVCCQPIRPDLDPSSVGLVQYGSKEKKKKGKKKKVGKKMTTKKKTKKKPKKRKKKKKKEEENKGLVQMLIDAEDEAWGDEEVKCDEIWVKTLKKRPCFWVYRRCPGLYPCFLQWHSCCTNCFSCCVMCLSTIVWCPLLVCVFFCLKLICRK